MSTVAKIDANEYATWLAWNETTQAVESVYVDPVTKALLIFGVAADANVPTTLGTAKIDGNDKPTLTALNDTTNNIEAVRCGVNGELLMKRVN